MEKLRKDLRSEHYKLGTDGPNTRFKSSAAESYKEPLDAEKAFLS